MIRKIYLIPLGLIMLAGTIPINAIQIMSVVIAPFSRKLFRDINRAIVGFWWGSVVVFLEYASGVRVVVTGDSLPQKENVVLFSNHQSISDIPALLCLGWRQGRIRDLKWFAKEALKYVPGIGWGMLFIDCVFLKRNWLSDRASVEKTFENLINHHVPFWMISFVEGTRITEAKKEKSQAHCRRRGLPVFENVLFPRTKGFTASVSSLRPNIDAVYDVTIGFVGRFSRKYAPSPWRLINGDVREIHLHVRRYPTNILPQSETDLADWLIERFKEKDVLRGRFLNSAGFS